MHIKFKLYFASFLPMPAKRNVKVKVVFWDGRKEEIIVSARTRIMDVLKKYNLNLEAVLCLLNSQLVTEDEEIVENSELKILSVVSGG